MEPQGRGAWHAHLLYIWQDMKAPFIPNEDFRELWGHGFVRIKKLDNVDNVGAYLTAYLGDMEITDLDVSQAVGKNCKIVETEDDNGNKVKKAIVKGARLDLYPSNFNMIRTSRGVKRPTEEMMTQFEANKKVSGATKTFEKTVKITDTEHHFTSVISTEYYNNLREL